MTADNVSGKTRQLNRIFWLGLLGVAVLFIILRWNNFNVPLTRDEGEYAYAGQLLRHGMAPYENSFLQKPPMVAYSYLLADLIAPHVFWFPRVLGAIFVAAATVLLALIARREFGPSVAVTAAWLMTPLILLPRIEEYTANTENFLLLPLMAAIYCYIRGRRRIATGTNWFWAAFFAATALLYKYTALPILAFLFAVWTFEEWRAGTKFSKLAVLWGWALLGGAIASFLILVFFLLRDGGKHLWECTVLFNRYYGEANGTRMTNIWFRVKSLVSAWWIIPALMPFAWFIKNRRRIWFWAGLFLTACVSTTGSLFGHYYILVMPFTAVLTAVGISNLAVLSRRRAQWPRPLALRVLTGIALVFLCLPDASFVLCSKEQFAEEKMRVWGSFIESIPAAERLAQLSAPNDLVYVAGSEPQILYYARRFSPTRFIIAYPLMIPTPLALGYQQELIQDLQQHQPPFIVAARTPTSWMLEEKTPKLFPDYLQDLLGKKYEAVGAYVYDVQGGHWQEPFLAGPNSRASLILFRRKHP